MNVVKQNLGIDVDSKEFKVSLQFLMKDLKESFRVDMLYGTLTFWTLK